MVAGESAVPGLECSGTVAATRTWSGLTTNLLIAAWSDTNNWVSHVRPGPGDDVLFPSTGQNRQNFNDLLTNLHSIIFADTGYVISGNTLTFTNGILATNTSGINVFSDEFSAPANFNLGANQSITNLYAGSTLALLTVDLEGKGLRARVAQRLERRDAAPA